MSHSTGIFDLYNPLSLKSVPVPMSLTYSSCRVVWCVVLAGATALLVACSPLALLNATVPTATYEASSAIAYAPGERHLLDVYKPAQSAGDAPVVIFFYGGNWNSGERADYRFAGEALAARGIVAVVPDYRLYPQVLYPDFLADSAMAVRWALDHIAEYGGDPRRIFVMGHSAGAYNAAMLALNPQYLAGVGASPRQLRGFIGLAGPYDFLPLTGDVTRAVFGYPDTPPATQPINFANSAAPPALLITGGDDDVVLPRNSHRLAARLRESGAQVREISYPRLGHRALVGALAAPLRGLAPVLDDVAAFVNGTQPLRQAGTDARYNRAPQPLSP